MDFPMTTTPVPRLSPDAGPVGATAGSGRARPRHWRDVDPARRGVVLAWVAFTATFIIARLITGVIKLASSTTGNATVHGVHLHHFLWGILLIFAVAIFGLVDRSPRTRTWMGVALGIGMGLVIDEAALLITLKDVYWHTQGWISVAIAVILISVVGTVLAFTRSGKYQEADGSTR
jgi:hypothetical protein